MEEILCMTDIQTDMAKLTAALGVVENAFQLLSTTIERPLASMSSLYWRKALDDEYKGKHSNLLMVSPNELVSDTLGKLYYVHPQDRHDLDDLDDLDRRDTQDANILEHGIITPGSKRDSWLLKHAVQMSRIIADPITVALDSPLWLAGKDTTQRLSTQLSDAFHDIVRGLLAVTANADKVLVTMPVIVFSPAADTPFQANVHIACRFGSTKCITQ
jgi:hypothetical protein